QHIVVDDEQARLIAEATEIVEIRDSRGRHLGYVAHGYGDEDGGPAQQRLALDQLRSCRLEPDQETDVEAMMDDSFPLAEEVRTYEPHKPECLDRQGQWVLIKGQEVVGFYPRYEAAWETEYRRFGPGPFLAHQTPQYEPIYNVPNI